jgi:hypothetical protein
MINTRLILFATHYNASSCGSDYHSASRFSSTRVARTGDTLPRTVPFYMSRSSGFGGSICSNCYCSITDTGCRSFTDEYLDVE